MNFHTYSYNDVEMRLRPERVNALELLDTMRDAVDDAEEEALTAEKRADDEVEEAERETKIAWEARDELHARIQELETELEYTKDELYNAQCELDNREWPHESD